MLMALVVSQAPPSLVSCGTTWYQKNYGNIIMWSGKWTSRREKKRKKRGVAVVNIIIVSGFLVCLLGLIALVIGHNTEHS